MNPIVKIKFQIGKNLNEELIINKKSEISIQLLTFFHKFNIQNREMKTIVKQYVINFIENAKKRVNLKIKINKDTLTLNPNKSNKLKIEFELKKNKHLEDKKFVKKNSEEVLNKIKKFAFCRRKSGIEKIQFNLINKLIPKKRNNFNKTNLQNKIKTIASHKSIKSTKKKTSKIEKIEGLEKLKLNLNSKEIETKRTKRTKINSIKNFLSFTKESPKKKYNKKKLVLDENDINWLGTFENKDDLKDINLYKDLNKSLKDKNINSQFQTKKYFFKKKTHFSSDVISIDKTLNNNMKTPSFHLLNKFSKIKKRGFKNKKNYFKDHFLFKIISKEEMKIIFNELDQKEIGLIGAKNLNLRKMSAKNLEIYENLFLHFYQNPNLLFDFEDFVYQSILHVKL